MNVCLFADEGLARYGFPEGHPFGIDRQDAFLSEANERGLLDRVQFKSGRSAERDVLERFHHPDYVDLVRTAESKGLEHLDAGDTPVFPGVFEAAAHVVGAALDGLDAVMNGECVRSFQPIGGLHHAARDHAAGFCVFNDPGVVIETLRKRYGVNRVAYIDIDVHFGDGVFYAFEYDADVIIADIHQDPRTFYPGTGFAHEMGKGVAVGTKLNLPLAHGSGDREFRDVWPQVERHLEKYAPEFFIFQCGADGLDGDPLAGLRYTQATHAYACKRLLELADSFAKGRLMAFGGGGYNRTNLGRAWSAVLAEMLN
ncbi:MAG: acetoin utilization protein AcuC [Betaproteobacteria bacterium]|nr:MAG: acetoin utilization protein AcuC [Betaproteobacteria bacterium]